MNRLKVIFWILIALAVAFGIAATASATTNISATLTEHFAWNDLIGWIDFYTPNTVYVGSDHIAGYASSSVGPISLDCATSPAGDVCSVSSYSVCNGSWTSGSGCASDANGILSGYAWNDEIGWISFNCYNHGNCSLSDYQVSILSNGDFSGYAWNDAVGWISFNGDPTYKVKTEWSSTSSAGLLDSAVIDTQSVGGAVLNSVTWYGAASANGASNDTYVGFQIAGSNCENGATNPPTCDSGSWTFAGPAGDAGTYYDTPCSISGFRGASRGLASPASASQGLPLCIDPAQISGYRYLRYRVFLRSDLLRLDTPRIDEIILNWSQ